MKYIKSFEQFVNESYNINEAKQTLSKQELEEKALKYLGIMSSIKSIESKGELSDDEKKAIETKIEKAQDKCYNAEDSMNDGDMSENKATKIMNYYESCIEIWKKLINSKKKPDSSIKNLTNENIKLLAIKLGQN